MFYRVQINDYCKYYETVSEAKLFLVESMIDVLDKKITPQMYEELYEKGVLNVDYYTFAIEKCNFSHEDN